MILLTKSARKSAQRRSGRRYLEKKLIIKRAVEENSLSKGIKHIEHIRYEILEKLYRNINNMLDLDLKNAMINEIERKKHIISPFI